MSESSVFVHKTTLKCAVYNDCIVCLHKIINKQSIPRSIESLIPPNQRPETCPRHNLSLVEQDSKLIYDDNIKILTLGDGDFSFSLSLINGGHPSTHLIATSYESYQSITTVYPNCKQILDTLKSNNVLTYHNVDATDIHASNRDIKLHSFDVVIWNFPCVGHKAGADGQASEIEINQQMLKTFFTNITSYFSPYGQCEVHLTHKTIEPFSWWGIEAIGRQCGFTLLGCIVFDR